MGNEENKSPVPTPPPATPAAPAPVVDDANKNVVPPAPVADGAVEGRHKVAEGVQAKASTDEERAARVKAAEENK